ncbi:hypothetical protein GDO86_006695, partial [Hymenochirus boettgeri]
DVVQYELNLGGKPLVLHLQKTQDLLSKNYTETHYLPDGTPVTSSPDIQNFCYYQGFVVNDDGSLASISTCNGLSGIIQAQGQKLLIEPLNKTDTEDHIVYEAEEDTPKTCGVTNTTYTEGKPKKSRSGTSAEKRAFLQLQKNIQLYIVADNSMFKKYNRSTEIVRKRIFEIINFVNMVYKSINTFVAVIGIEIWNIKDQFNVVTSASQNLGSFSDWRKNNLLPRCPNDNAQFITNIDFDGATVGLAFVGTMCSDSHSTGVIQSSCTCKASSCIMSPSPQTPRSFSTCSFQEYDDYLLNGNPTCMKNVPEKKSILTPPVCGNKFTELGEDCDCGTWRECTNPCCDAATCKLQETAKCAEGQCCENCQLKKGGSVCRPAKDDCDLADMCDGISAECPSDRFRVNGYTCNNGQGYCLNGKCPIMQDQCTALWGASAVLGENYCFDMNKRGTNYAYCTQSGSNFIACQPKDVKCGVLFCYGGSDQPNVYASMVTVSNCKGVLGPLGLVENGSKCGEGMVCANGSCLSTESAYRSTNCSAKCSGHAVCDHEMQCQCEEGWAPPNCDSASASSIVIIIVVIIIAIALIVGLILLTIYCRRVNSKKQSSPPTIDGSTNQGFHQAQMKSFSQLSTPEQSSRNQLYPVPSPALKPQIFYPAADRLGYQAPSYAVTSGSPQTDHKIKKPTAPPPPIPSAKPTPPPAPPKILKPPVNK